MIKRYFYYIIFKSFLHAYLYSVFIPIERIYLDDELSLREIPTPTWKQFVVNRSEKMTLSELQSRRTCFWAKEHLLGGIEYKGRLIGKWNFGRGRSGTLRKELRDAVGIINSSMLNVLRTEDVSILCQLIHDDEDHENSHIEESHDQKMYFCPMSKFLKLEWTIINRRGKVANMISCFG